MIFYHLLYCKEQSHNHSSFVNFCVLGVRSFEGTHFNKFLTHFRFLTITSSPVHSDGYITANYCNDNDDEEPRSLSVLTKSLFKIAANRTWSFKFPIGSLSSSYFSNSSLKTSICNWKVWYIIITQHQTWKLCKLELRSYLTIVLFLTFVSPRSKFGWIMCILKV